MMHWGQQLNQGRVRIKAYVVYAHIAEVPTFNIDLMLLSIVIHRTR